MPAALHAWDPEACPASRDVGPKGPEPQARNDQHPSGGSTCCLQMPHLPSPQRHPGLWLYFCVTRKEQGG